MCVCVNKYFKTWKWKKKNKTKQTKVEKKDTLRASLAGKARVKTSRACVYLEKFTI